MRIAIQMYHGTKNELSNVIRAYEEMSVGWYTPASPTIFNAGMEGPQMSSCFLLTIGDTLESILGGVYNSGIISAGSGGLGIDVSRIRHSEIRKTGWSSGIIPMLQLYNSMVGYVDEDSVKEPLPSSYDLTTLMLKTLSSYHVKSVISMHEPMILTFVCGHLGSSGNVFA